MEWQAKAQYEILHRINCERISELLNCSMTLIQTSINAEYKCVCVGGGHSFLDGCRLPQKALVNSLVNSIQFVNGFVYACLLQ